MVVVEANENVQSLEKTGIEVLNTEFRYIWGAVVEQSDLVLLRLKLSIWIY